jgi:hypothetical protein
MGFPSKMFANGSVATISHDNGEYIVTITVERKAGKPITPEEAEAILTRTVPLMFIQRSRY